MTKKMDWNIIVDKFIDLGLILLSNKTDYVNSHSLLKFICPKHIEKGEQLKSWNNLNSKNQGCKYCSRKLADNKRSKYDFYFVLKEFEKNNCKLLLTEDEFNSFNNKVEEISLSFICTSHQEKGVQNKNWKAFLKSGGSCRHCSNEAKNKEKHLKTFTVIKEAFDNRKFNLLTTFEEYVGRNSNLKYICPNHPNKIQTTNWDSIKNYIHDEKYSCCRDCANEKLANERKQDINEIKREFEERNCILLEDEFKNNKTEMKYICLNFPNKVQYTTLSNFRAIKCCKECKKVHLSELKRQGCIRELSIYLRDCIRDWKFQSMKECGYKCVISNSKFEVVHHLYGFDLILKESLVELNLPIHNDYNEYSLDDLMKLKEKILEIHFRYPLGVCLTKDIHKEFHSIYGYGNNTPEQFYEFKAMKQQELANLNKNTNSIKEVKNECFI